jgi:hypothetical protein
MKPIVKWVLIGTAALFVLGLILNLAGYQPDKSKDSVDDSVIDTAVTETSQPAAPEVEYVGTGISGYDMVAKCGDHSWEIADDKNWVWTPGPSSGYVVKAWGNLDNPEKYLIAFSYGELAEAKIAVASQMLVNSVGDKAASKAMKLIARLAKAKRTSSDSFRAGDNIVRVDLETDNGLFGIYITPKAAK